MDREKTLETLTEWFDNGMINYENLPKLADELCNQWVDVNDRLPREDTYSQLAQIVNGTHRRIPVTGRFAGDKWQVTTWVGEEKIFLPLEMVTHWKKADWEQALPRSPGGRMNKARLTELIEELMRLNNELTAVLIQLSVYLKEDK